MKQTNIQIPELLRRLSRQTLDNSFLGSFNGSEIYQLQAGWQKEVLANDDDVVIAMSSTEFEDAVIAPEVSSILVPCNAALTQEIVERILLRNSLSKTIYWEITQA